MIESLPANMRSKITVVPSGCWSASPPTGSSMSSWPDVHKTHCVHGHELTPENTVVKARPNGRSIRNCRTCGNTQRRKAA